VFQRAQPHVRCGAQTVVSDLAKPFGQHVLEQAPQKLDLRQRAGATVLGRKGHALLIATQDASVGDSDPMRIPA
jgi:hypothetical protein